MKVKGKFVAIVLLILFLTGRGVCLILGGGMEKEEVNKSIAVKSRELSNKRCVLLSTNSSKKIRKLKANSFLPLVLIALMTFLLISGPSWAKLLFGGAFLLEIIYNTFLKENHDGERRLKISQLNIRHLKRQLSKKKGKEELINEEKNLIMFIKKNHINQLKGNKKRILYNTVRKYMKERYNVKGKSFERRLRRVVNLIYAKKEKILSVVNHCLHLR